MFKKIFTVVKRIVFYAFLLYGYNLLASPLNVMIPINVITVATLTVFGLPALFSFILIFVLIYWGVIC